MKHVEIQVGKGHGGRRNRAGSRGQALAEFAILAPLLMLMLLAAIDFGRLFATYITVSNAAREAAVYAIQNGGDPAGATTAAKNEDHDPSVTVFVCPGGSGCAQPPSGMVSVTVTQPFTFWTPFIQRIFGGGTTLPLSVTASGDIL